MSTRRTIAAALALLAQAAPQSQPASRPSSAPEPADVDFVEGRAVAAEDGQPLAGCTIKVTGHQATGYPLHWQLMDWRDPDEVVTGADGKFRVPVPVPSGPDPRDGYPPRYHVLVTHAERGERSGSQILPLLHELHVHRLDDLTLARAARAQARVVDTAGRAQPDVDVWALLQLPADKREKDMARMPVQAVSDGRSDARGHLTFAHLTPGTWQLRADGRTLSAPQAIEIGPDLATPPTVDIVVTALDPELCLAGRIVDSAAHPVAGLRLGTRARPVGEPASYATTQRDGSFVVQCPQGGADVELTVPLNSRYDWFQSLGRFAVGSRDLRIVVPRSGSVALEVVARGSGKPVEEFSLRCRPIDGENRLAAPVRRSAHFAGGRVAIQDLRPGEYEVVVFPHDPRLVAAEPVLVTVREGAPSTLRVTLAAALTRDVVVRTAAGHPVAGTRIELLFADAEPDPNAPLLRIVPLACEVPTQGRRKHPMRAFHGTTDAAGQVTIVAPRSEESVFLHLLGPGHPPAMQAIADWNAGRGPIDVVVPAAATLRVTLTPLDRVRALGDATVEEVRDAEAFGLHGNEWRRGIADLLAQRRACLLIETDGAKTLTRPSPVDDRGRVDLRDVPAGRVRLMLVTWQRVGNAAKRVDHPEPLAELDLRAGETRDLELTLPAGLGETSR